MSASDPRTPFRWAGQHFLIDLPGAQAVFTTRRGGHSKGPYTSLNLSSYTEDHPRAVERNRADLAGAHGVAPVWGRQVHGAAVGVCGPEDRGEQEDEADGRVTRVAGIAPMVTTADCLAIALAGGGAVGMLHAGWRGLAAGVIEDGVRRLRALGGVGSDLAAAIGPHARVCCYEVGQEVHQVFAQAGYDDARDGARLDLTQIAVAKLHEVGVAEVHDLGLCTMCSDDSLFFSHRRDGGVTGRQAGLVWLT